MPRPDPFDPDRLRLPAADPACQLTRQRAEPPRHRPGEPFLKGPIPWHWITRAAALPGKALAVGLLLWREAGCRKARTVPLSLAAAAALGVKPDAARRGVRALAAAGLVSVSRPPGRCLDVTLLDAPPPAVSAAPTAGGNETPRPAAGAVGTGPAWTVAGRPDWHSCNGASPAVSRLTATAAGGPESDPARNNGTPARGDGRGVDVEAFSGSKRPGTDGPSNDDPGDATAGGDTEHNHKRAAPSD
jgi:hypothetical protein